jgi:hypothetical protein
LIASLDHAGVTQFCATQASSGIARSKIFVSVQEEGFLRSSMLCQDGSSGPPKQDAPGIRTDAIDHIFE